MKTRTKIFYHYDNGYAADMDQWVAETPGDIKDIRIVQHGQYGVVMVVMYTEHDTTDWGPG